MDKHEAISRLKENPLDKERWIEAGKALGWEEEWNGQYTSESVGHQRIMEDGWIIHWHRFITHLADGKSPDSFFKDLLEK